MEKNLPANARETGDAGLIGKFPWRRKWQPTPVFLPGKSHGTEEPGGLFRRAHGVAKNQVCMSDWAHMHSYKFTTPSNSPLEVSDEA